uniref:Cell cycle associated protein 1b n=1 Tax=Astyanax mexicanus TaxID=7994 RepID=A0A8B9HA89_ASTMX
MPSATNGIRTVKSTSPEEGFAQPSINQISSSSLVPGSQSEAMKQVLGVIEKKVRNMEKKKSKLDDYQARINKGERLNHDQLDALSKYQEVSHNLEFARELHKSFLALNQDIQKAVKKAARREQLQREEVDQARLRKLLEVQFLLDRLGDEAMRQELLRSAGRPALLTESELAALDDFYKLVGPERDQNIRLTDQYQEASQHFWDLLEGKDKPVVGTTYKHLKEMLERVLQSGCFERVESHQNGVCAEDGDQPEDAVETCEVVGETIRPELSNFVNTQFIPETTDSSCEKEQEEEWCDDTKVMANSLQQPVHSPPNTEAPLMTSETPPSSSDPLVRNKEVQDLMAQMQGPYNFMQDSMLEFDAQSLDAAVVSAQPMNPVKSMEVPQMVCPSAHPQSHLAQPLTVPVQTESTQVSIVSPSPEAYSSPPPSYQTSHTADPRPRADSEDPIHVPISLTEHPPSSTALAGTSQPQVFQPSSKPLCNSGINVNAAPFQSMQTVINATLPELCDTSLLPCLQCHLCLCSAVVGSFQEQSLNSCAGHPTLSQQPVGPGATFNRQPQSFYNSRGVSRGGPRNSRGVINGYRGPSNSFRGGYDGYRPPFSGTPNSGYGQVQFGAARDYSNTSYQRDGFQQNYKRPAGPGPRGVPRGNAQAMRS